jgi:hypothetical protein
MMKAYCLSLGNHGFSNDKWDFGFLSEAFNKKKIEVVQSRSLPKDERAFVVVPGAEWSGQEDKLSKELSKIDRVVLFVTADEVGRLRVDNILHNNITIWIQYPYPRHSQYHKLPTGAPIHIHDLKPEYSTKKYDVYFAGQITHQRRTQLAESIVNIKDAKYNLTKGFAKGDDPKEYYQKLFLAKYAPSPAGAATIDSFRFYEALEMLCLPIADSVSSIGENYGFWELLFETMPVVQTDDWNKLQSIVDSLNNDYPANLHRAVCWWIKYKRDFANKIMEQINEH